MDIYELDSSGCIALQPGDLRVIRCLGVLTIQFLGSRTTVSDMDSSERVQITFRFVVRTPL
jgi:hypothetical protein